MFEFNIADINIFIYYITYIWFLETDFFFAEALRKPKL